MAKLQEEIKRYKKLIGEQESTPEDVVLDNLGEDALGLSSNPPLFKQIYNKRVNKILYYRVEGDIKLILTPTNKGGIYANFYVGKSNNAIATGNRIKPTKNSVDGFQIDDENDNVRIGNLVINNIYGFDKLIKTIEPKMEKKQDDVSVETQPEDSPTSQEEPQQKNNDKVDPLEPDMSKIKPVNVKSNSQPKAEPEQSKAEPQVNPEPIVGKPKNAPQAPEDNNTNKNTNTNQRNKTIEWGNVLSRDPRAEKFRKKPEISKEIKKVNSDPSKIFSDAVSQRQNVAKEKALFEISHYYKHRNLKVHDTKEIKDGNNYYIMNIYDVTTMFGSNIRSAIAFFETRIEDGELKERLLSKLKGIQKGKESDINTREGKNKMREIVLRIKEVFRNTGEQNENEYVFPRMDQFVFSNNVPNHLLQYIVDQAEKQSEANEDTKKGYFRKRKRWNSLTDLKDRMSYKENYVIYISKNKNDVPKKLSADILINKLLKIDGIETQGAGIELKPATRPNEIKITHGGKEQIFYVSTYKLQGMIIPFVDKILGKILFGLTADNKEKKSTPPTRLKNIDNANSKTQNFYFDPK